jgi:hypothetical protein
MDDITSKIRNVATKNILVGRWLAMYNGHFLFRDNNNVPTPESFTAKDVAVKWMENELERMGIHKDRGIDRYRVIGKMFDNSEETYLDFEANVRTIRVRWALVKVTDENIQDMKKMYFREAKKMLSRWPVA